MSSLAHARPRFLPRPIVHVAALIAVTIVSAGAQRPATPASGAWRLVWSDEFDGPAGSRPDPARWSHDTGDGCGAGNCGWGNGEREHYADDPSNVALTGNGALSITARVAPAGLSCYYGPCRYTSGKVKTQGKVGVGFGRVEARIKLPRGQGLWPAFWMLGDGFPATPWPQCGELDIMEFRGSRSWEVSSAMHGPGYSGDTPFVHHHAPPGADYTGEFHRYAVEWDATQVRFLVDDALHYTVNRDAVAPFGAWAFDSRFFIILNLAVGGKFDGDPASDTIFPATMLVDYVRVYVRVYER